MRWWRKLTGKDSSADHSVGARRRASERFPYQAKLGARCSSWPRLEQLLTGDVSAGGLYIPTTMETAIGERVEIALTLPDSSVLDLTGEVVAIVGAEQAARHGKPPGIGVKLDPLVGEGKGRFDELLAVARRFAPEPEPEPEPIPPPPPPVAPKAPAPLPVVVARRVTGPTIGIDLGTSYTSVAAVRGRKVTILARDGGARSIPSVIWFPSPIKRVIGAEARGKIASDPKHTVASPKRLLGRRFDEKDIQPYLAQAAYKTTSGPDGQILVEMWDEPYAVTQLCAYILDDVRELAERALGEKVTRAVVTVPVTFDEPKTKMLRRAGQLAGLEIVATIDEPSAAAVANRFQPGFGGVVGVYDFGGGTFDFTVVDVSKGDFQVLATAGDSWLGGDDLDSAIADAVANHFWRQHQVDVRKSAVEWQRLLFACEQAKRELSADDYGLIRVPEIHRTAAGMVDLELRIDRATLERVCAPPIERSLQTCSEALELLEMKPGDLSAIYLSGGTTYIPAVREAVARHFGVPVKTGVPPEHAVCLGAGIHAAQMQMESATTL